MSERTDPLMADNFDHLDDMVSVLELEEKNHYEDLITGTRVSRIGTPDEAMAKKDPRFGSHEEKEIQGNKYLVSHTSHS
jgi:hypothetical protein